MEFTTTDTQNDTFVVSVETFLELYHDEAPEEDQGQPYFDGFAVKVVKAELGLIYLQTVNGNDLLTKGSQAPSEKKKLKIF